MPFKCPIRKKEYERQYRLSNREKKNKATEKWKKNNPEKNHKSYSISMWLYRGVIDADIQAVYKYFITQTHCWICDIEYCKKYKRCLDHDHDTGEIRYICCSLCNTNVVG